MENHSEKIQDYLEGHLKGDDLAQFEEQLRLDDELRNLLSLQKEVNEILNKRIVSEEVELRSNLSTITNNFRHDTSSKVINFKKIISFVAAACILIIGGVFLFNGSDKDLYELPLLQSEIVRGSTINVSYEDAIQSFNQKAYADARRQFEMLTAANPDQVQYTYYIGLTYLGDKDWKKAIDRLIPIANGETVFSDEAKYYLAVAYFENGDEDKALVLLKDLESHKAFAAKTKKLLERIN